MLDINGRSYSVNYISTIWKQHISKQIVKYAYLWWEEHTHPIDGTITNMFKWKVCPECQRTLYAHEINFGKYADGTWKDMCKDCAITEKELKERLREEKRARKYVKKRTE